MILYKNSVLIIEAFCSQECVQRHQLCINLSCYCIKHGSPPLPSIKQQQHQTWSYNPKGSPHPNLTTSTHTFPRRSCALMVTIAAPPQTRRNTCRKCTVWSPESSLECRSLWVALNAYGSSNIHRGKQQWQKQYSK